MALDVDALIRLSRVGEIAESPDGSWLAVVVQRLSSDGSRYVSDLWRVPTDGSAAIALTRGDCKDTAPRFRADGVLGFLSDRKPGTDAAADDDGKRTQAWRLPPTGEPAPLTDEPLGVADFDFVDGGIVALVDVVPGVALADMRKHEADRAKHGPSALRYRRGELPVRHWDDWLPPTALHLVAIASDGARRDLTPDARHELRSLLFDQKLAVSPDRREVCVLWTRQGSLRVPESSLRRYDLKTGAHVEIGVAPRVIHFQPRWSPDGKTIAAMRLEMRPKLADKVSLWKWQIGGDPAGTPVAPAWDAMPMLHEFTRDGAALLCTADHEGTTPIYRVAIDGDSITRITSVAAGGSHDAVRGLPDGKRAACVRSTVLHPPEAFVVDLAAEATPRPLAALSGFGYEDGAAIATVESKWVAGDGGERVQTFVIRPRGATKPPVLFWIHGGPISAFTDGWHWRWNALVAAAAGYAVAMPNPRGSTGRGQAFADGVCGNQWGAACYLDLMACADDLVATPDVDGTRMAAMGGSFGGYMVNWIGGQTDRFAAIVSHAGITAFREFYGVTDYPAYFAIEMGGAPWDDGTDYARYSPDTHLARWKTPALIIHGEKDYRCPIGEGLILFEALDARGVDVEMLIFPDEGHWIQKPKNIRAWYTTWLDFVGKRLGSAR
jgi:dipeptidyl aminopeptidase/acylaminoacyl peptidase